MVTELATRSDVGAHSLPTPLKERPAAPTGWARLRSALGTSAIVLLAIALVGAALAVNIWHLKFETVLSGSMRPGIQPGDIVILRPVPVDTIEVGEVIAYVPPQQQRPVLHRVIELSDAGFLTQGDANNVPDPWGTVKSEGTSVDTLVATVPKIGFLRDAKGLIVIGGLALLIAAGAIALWPRRKSETSAEGSDNTAAYDGEAGPQSGSGDEEARPAFAGTDGGGSDAAPESGSGTDADPAWRDPHTATSGAAQSERRIDAVSSEPGRGARATTRRRKRSRRAGARASPHAMSTIAAPTSETPASENAPETGSPTTERHQK